MGQAPIEQENSSRTLLGVCLGSIFGGSLGFIVGGVYGIKDYNAAMNLAIQESGFADFLPVFVPFFAAIGSTIGAISGILIYVAYRLLRLAFRRLK